MSFSVFGLHPSLLQSIVKQGYTAPTPIQEQAIPVAMKGSDILASAQTGTGKTAAFMLPLLHRLTQPSAVTKSKGPRVLVLTPTRELADQIADASNKLGGSIAKLSTVSIVGGVPYFKQRKQMSRFVDIMIATPGRLIDYLGQGAMDFSRLEALVLDEADRMLDMGFRDAVKEILEVLPESRQTLLFSATIDKEIGELAKKILKDPVRIEIASQQARHELITQRIEVVSDLRQKRERLIEILAADDVSQALIFTATKRSADQLADQLDEYGLKAGALHGDMRQSARNRTLALLKTGTLRFVVATDVAARGIDVPQLSHIINFDLPRQPEDYVHRIGRTGRAGARGIAISLAYPIERGMVRRLESFLGHPIEGHNFNEKREPGKERGPRSENSSFGRSSFGGSRGGMGGDRRGQRSDRSDRGGDRSERRSFAGDRLAGEERPAGRFGGERSDRGSRDGRGGGRFNSSRGGFNRGGPRGGYRGGDAQAASGESRSETRTGSRSGNRAPSESRGEFAPSERNYRNDRQSDRPARSGGSYAPRTARDGDRPFQSRGGERRTGGQPRSGNQERSSARPAGQRGFGGGRGRPQGGNRRSDTRGTADSRKRTSRQPQDGAVSSDKGE
jgi:superfamily II DNA/RNA helicase